MEQTIKQCVGIDIAKTSFTACVCKRLLSGEIKIISVESFDNDKHGFNQLIKWHRKLTDPSVETLFLMEATGIYYESIAFFLHRLNLSVSVILPNKVKHYAKSLNIKTKTDIVDARIIAQMGAERQLPIWQPAPQILRQDQIKQCEREIEKLLFADEWLSKKINKLMTIKGVGLITLAIIIAETQGFALVNNRKQLSSYAGYDIVKRESGTSVKGKTRISKKGNSRIRAALYFPSMVASRYNPDLKEDYQRINLGKPSKMIGITALQRKILLLIFTLWKNDEVYRENKSSGNRETKILLRQKKNDQKKVGNSIELPTQDKLPYNCSTEALLRQPQRT